MGRPPGAGRARGALLLETLLALAITAIVLSTLYSAVVHAAGARVRAAARTRRDDAARAALLAIAGEIEAALVPEPTAGPRRFVVAAPTAAAPPWSVLRLATMVRDGPQPSPLGDSRIVGYRVEDGADGRGTLVRREASPFAPPDAAEPAGVPLVYGVQQFGVRCLDEAGWHDAWTQPVLPRAAELLIRVEDGPGHTLELRVVVAPVQAGAG